MFSLPLAVIVLLLLAGVEGDTNYVLQGRLGEYQGEPVTIRCKEDYGYIRLGGITVNNIELNKVEQTNATDQCKIQMEKIIEYYKGQVKAGKPVKKVKGTKCIVSFPGMNITDDDVIRVVYTCYDEKPLGSLDPWGKEEGSQHKLKTQIRNDAGMLTFSCGKQKETLFVTEAKVNGEGSDHPDLNHVRLTEICMAQQKVNMEDVVKKYYPPSCSIENKASYGGSLEIIYTCI